MKSIYLFTILFFLVATSFSQTIIAETEDGRRVLLNEDKTWEFIDKEVVLNSARNSRCNLPEDFEEPRGKNSAFLRKGDATLEDLKKHVAIDYDCSVENVIIIRASEQKGNGNYLVCANGVKVKYKRAGTVFFKSGEIPLGN